MYIYALLTRYVVVKAKCWPRSFRVFLWTEWKSRLIKMEKNNLANIHPFLTEQVCAIKFVPGKKANHVFSTLNPQESSMFLCVKGSCQQILVKILNILSFCSLVRENSQV